MDYSPWSSKNVTDRNQLKKLIQVGIDVLCMYTNFGGCGLSGFGDTVTFKNGQISLSDHGLWNRLKKFMKVDVDVSCMYTDFGGRSYFSFGDTATFKNGQISLSDHGL